MINRLRRTLEPSISDVERTYQLELDDDTTWFGVVRDSSDRESLDDHGRFATLIAESAAHRPSSQEQYPQLVSFVGQAGK